METYVVTATVEIYVSADSEDLAREEVETQLSEIAMSHSIESITY